MAQRQLTVDMLDAEVRGGVNRYKNVPAPRRQTLPVWQFRADFLRMYYDVNNQALVVVSGTGSGKTTQISQLVARAEDLRGKKVIVTQPRRLSAKECCTRVAAEMDVAVGTEVRYQMRGDNKFDQDETKLTFMTEGILVNLLTNGGLDDVGCVIVDEAHERSQNTDIILGLLKDKAYGDESFKIIIMSATIDTTAFERYFGAGSLQLPGNTFEVEVAYSTGRGPSYLKEACELVLALHEQYLQDQQQRQQDPVEPQGNDILVFLTGYEDISRASNWIRRRMPTLEVHCLYSSLSPERQRAALTQTNSQRCILATNIAETSITIGGVKSVIDCGLVKQMKYNPRLGSTFLAEVQISRASANQRKGRTGRTGPGQCYRLYSEEAYNAMPETTLPAVQSENLAQTVLRLKHAGFHDAFMFDWLDSPAPECLLKAIQDLLNLGMLDDEGNLTGLEISAIDFPADMEWFAVCDRARELNCLVQMTLAAALRNLRHGTIFEMDDDNRHYHIVNKGAFASGVSDHLTELNAMAAYIGARSEHHDKYPLSDWCEVHHINQRSAEEAFELYQSLEEWWTAKLGDGYATSSTPNTNIDFPDLFRRCLVAGFAHQTAFNNLPGRGEVYRTFNTDVRAYLEPTSMLSEYLPEWVIYDNLHMSGRPLLLKCTAIDAELLVHHPAFQDDRLKRDQDGQLLQPRVSQSIAAAKARAAQRAAELAAAAAARQ